MKTSLKYLLTAVVVLLAVAAVMLKYRDYVTNPWTRDGQVRAQVIQITPRVSGPIIKLPIQDNRLVKTGDLLFEIDQRTFAAAVREDEADLQQAQVQLAEKKDEADRATRIRERDKGAMPLQTLTKKQNAVRAARAEVMMAEAALTNSKLDLEFTQVKAPVDGYVTNLNLRTGSQAVANQPALALVDIDSFWVHGYFREDRVEGINEGDRAIVTLMSYPDRPLEGHVDSLGWGIAQTDGSTGYNLLPTISPTFEWIRLAQRVPVRVHLTDLPDDIRLRVGTTASVMVMTGDDGTAKPIPALPSALQ